MDMNNPGVELDRILQNPEHVIMSDDLSLLLGEHVEVNEKLMINETPHLCTLQSAKMQDVATEKWQFVFVVPGLDFSDLFNAKQIVFLHNEDSFDMSLASIEYEKIGADRHLTLTGTRIFKENE